MSVNYIFTSMCLFH